jgi:hypothetical protein
MRLSWVQISIPGTSWATAVATSAAATLNAVTNMTACLMAAVDFITPPVMTGRETQIPI